jgi:hypothetical protein
MTSGDCSNVLTGQKTLNLEPNRIIEMASLLVKHCLRSDVLQSSTFLTFLTTMSTKDLTEILATLSLMAEEEKEEVAVKTEEKEEVAVKTDKKEDSGKEVILIPVSITLGFGFWVCRFYLGYLLFYSILF